MVIRRVRKRTGETVAFNSWKITAAIEKAMKAVGEHDRKEARVLTDGVVKSLGEREKSFFKGIPGIEDIQNIVEQALMRSKFQRTAKAYLLYRKSRAHARELREYFKIKDDLKLDVNAIKVLQERYLLKNEKGEIIETPTELFKRVARAVAHVDKYYGENIDHVKEIEKEFFNAMKNLEFMPNTPTLFNAETELGQLSACFTEEQPIMTSQGIKPIKEIKVGDLVLTASGKFSIVNKTMQRMAKSRYKINVLKLPSSTLSVTGDHPILALKGNKPSWVMVKDLKEGDFVAISYPRETQDLEEIELIDFLSDKRFFVKENLIYRKNTDSRLRSGEVSKQVKPVKNRIVVDEELLRLLGYFASEGDIDGKDCIRFTFSNKETVYAQDVIEILKEKFNISSKIESSNFGNWINVRANSLILCELFEKIIGKGFNKKVVPSWILKLPKEKQKGFIIGAFRGDSTLFLNKHVHNARLVMSNVNLVYAVWVMLMRRGVVPSFRKEKVPALGRTNPYSCLIKSAESKRLMEEIYLKRVDSPTQASMQRISEKLIGDTVFLPIKSIEYVEEEALVYNFEVEGEHTYVANCVAVHNCFVLPIDDSLESIFTTLKHTATIQQSGGGTGFSFSQLRPKGDMVKSTKGTASGPVSFIKIYDQTTEVIKQGGKRRGANMAILHVSHPDILEFVTAKKGSKHLSNFNISVAADDKFMKAVIKGKKYPLINPRMGEIVNKIDAKELFNFIAQNAWETGDPGMIFIDEINKYNPVLKTVGKIEATNPCGEVPLLPYESCNLGSINLSKVYDEKSKDIDWGKLCHLVRLGIHFLDNVIDANRYPIPELEKAAKENRRIGLGVMGFADLLIKIGIPYNSPETIKLAEKIAKFISDEADKRSIELANERGSFPNFKGSALEKKFKAIRNVARTTIAPTGTISIISGCSSGIEPLFAVAFMREVLGGKHLFEVNKEFQSILLKEGLYDDKLLDKIAKQGNLKGIKLPKEIKDLFVTALEISPEHHIKIQAAFQKYTDNAVSKTINLPNSAKPKDIAAAYLLAYKLKCKGITVYRYGSKPSQVLYLGEGKKYTKANIDFSGGTCIGKVCTF